MLTTKVYLEGQAKLRELILYICRKSEGDENFGLTKLNKILFFSDFACYAEKRESITNEEYMRLPQGPVPKIMKLLLDSMEANEDIRLFDRVRFGFKQKQPYAAREPDLSQFSGKEIAIVDEWIERCRPYNASEISRISHRFSGWQLAQENQTIPYAAAFLDNSPLSQEDKEYANTIDLSGIEEELFEDA